MVVMEQVEKVGHKMSEVESYLATQLLGGWSPADIPDLTGKTALVTGGNSGLGFEAARKLAENGAQVYMVSRDLKNGQEAAQKIRAEIGKSARVEVLQCDMSALENVVTLAREFKQHSKTLDILVNMAGVFHPGPFAQTVDGIEQTLAINYYSHALLTLRLLDTLRATPHSRVVFMASAAEAYGRLDWSNLKGDKFKDSGLTPYGTSKVFLMMFSYELATRVPEVDFFCVHPGLVMTPLQHKTSFMYWTTWVVTTAARFVGQTPHRGAYSTLYAATEPSLTGTHWGYYGPNSFNLWPTSRREPGQAVIKNPVACWKLFEETVRVLHEVIGHRHPFAVPRHPDNHFGTKATPAVAYHKVAQPAKVAAT